MIRCECGHTADDRSGETRRPASAAARYDTSRIPATEYLARRTAQIAMRLYVADRAVWSSVYAPCWHLGWLRLDGLGAGRSRGIALFWCGSCSRRSSARQAQELAQIADLDRRGWRVTTTPATHVRRPGTAAGDRGSATDAPVMLLTVDTPFDPTARGGRDRFGRRSGSGAADLRRRPAGGGQPGLPAVRSFGDHDAPSNRCDAVARAAAERGCRRPSTVFHHPRPISRGARHRPQPADVGLLVFGPDAEAVRPVALRRAASRRARGAS